MLKDADVDLTMYTVAAVIKPKGEPQVSMDPKELKGVLTPPLLFGQAPTGQMLITSQRDQIEAWVSLDNANVRNLSGKRDFMKSKVPDVLSFFMEKVGGTVRAYGINFLMTLPCSNPRQWIADNILDNYPLATSTHQFVNAVK